MTKISIEKLKTFSFLLLLAFSFNSFANKSKRDKIINKYKSKIASQYEIKRSQQVMDNLLNCKKSHTKILDLDKCTSPFIAPYLSKLVKSKIAYWILRIKNPERLKICTLDDLMNHPSVLEDNHDIVACFDFFEGRNKKRAVVSFDQKGKNLFFRAGKY